MALNLCLFQCICVRHLYLASDVWGHGRGGLGVDVCILGHKARIVGGDAAEAVGGDAPRWQRLVRQAAAVAIGGGGWGGRVGLGASTAATNTTTTASPWRTGGTTVGAVDAAAGGWQGKVQRSRGGRRDGREEEDEGVGCQCGVRTKFFGERAWLQGWFNLGRVEWNKCVRYEMWLLAKTTNWWVEDALEDFATCDGFVHVMEWTGVEWVRTSCWFIRLVKTRS